MEKIVYNYVSRTDVLSKDIKDALNYIYSLSYPKPEHTFTEMCEILRKECEENGKDPRIWRKKYGRYQWPIDFFYIPNKVVDDIRENRIEANNAKNLWHEYIDHIIEIFKSGGLKEVYEPTQWSEGRPMKQTITTASLDKEIGQDNAEKVIQMLEDYRNTYRFGGSDQISYSFSFADLAPCSNRETVTNAWKELGKDITIPEDDTWVDEYYEFDEDED